MDLGMLHVARRWRCGSLRAAVGQPEVHVVDGHTNPTASRAFHTIRPVMVMPLKPPQKSPLARDINILAVLPEAVQASRGSGPRHQLVVPL